MFYKGNIKAGVWTEFEAFDGKGRNITNKPENGLVRAMKGSTVGNLLDVKG